MRTIPSHQDDLRRKSRAAVRVPRARALRIGSAMKMSCVSMVCFANLLSALGCEPVPPAGLADGGSGGSGGADGSGVVSTNTTSGPTSNVTSAAATSGSSSASTTPIESTSAAGSTGAGGATDPAAICVDTINQLRATRGLMPYQRWTPNEACVSDEAKTDASMMSPHYSFGHFHMCGGYAQDECPNWSPNPLDSNGIAQCLNAMWGEQNKAACSGCDSCDFPYQNCESCDFTSCGHFLNMKSSVLSMVACGFADAGWYAQDFQ
jgi:hypothetical protein